VGPEGRCWGLFARSSGARAWARGPLLARRGFTPGTPPGRSGPGGGGVGGPSFDERVHASRSGATPLLGDLRLQRWTPTSDRRGRRAARTESPPPPRRLGEPWGDRCGTLLFAGWRGWPWMTARRLPPRPRRFFLAPRTGRRRDGRRRFFFLALRRVPCAQLPWRSPSPRRGGGRARSSGGGQADEALRSQRGGRARIFFQRRRANQSASRSTSAGVRIGGSPW